MRITRLTQPGVIGRMALLAFALMLTACGTAGPTAPAPSASLPPLPAGSCGDDQPDRYLTEIFDAAPTVTTTYTDSQQVDIYRPAGDPASCRVGVVWVHGGGFTQASRDGSAEHAWGAALARRGYLLASIDYHLGTGEPFSLDEAQSDPQKAAVVDNAVADAQSALGWIVDNAADLGVDPDRIAIGGTSAGAMIALGAGLTSEARTRPCTIVSVAGDLDSDWVGDTPPAVLLIHGDADQLVPYGNAEDSWAALLDKGDVAELVTIAGAGHEITGPPTDDIVMRTAQWLRERVAAGCT